MWFLLHYTQVCNKLSAKDLKKQLKKYIPKYSKTGDNYSIVKSKTNRAIISSKKLLGKKYNEINWQEVLSEKGNPSTNVYQLIEQIQKMYKKD